MNNSFATNGYLTMLAGHYVPNPSGGVCLKSHDKNYAKKKNHRKVAKASKRKNRKA